MWPAGLCGDCGVVWPHRSVLPLYHIKRWQIGFSLIRASTQRSVLPLYHAQWPQIGLSFIRASTQRSVLPLYHLWRPQIGLSFIRAYALHIQENTTLTLHRRCSHCPRRGPVIDGWINAGMTLGHDLYVVEHLDRLHTDRLHNDRYIYSTI